MSEQVEIGVEGMTCDHCVQAVTTAVRSTPGGGDADVQVDLDGGTVRATGGDLDREAIVEAIVEAGYEISA